jgi:hypothetical protein
MSTNLAQKNNFETKDYSWIENAVLFYGPRKSGTTLLQNLFDGGQQLLMRQGELKLKQFADELWANEKQATERYYRKKRRIGIRKGDKVFENFDHTPFMKAIHKDSRNNSSFKDLMTDEIQLIYDAIEDKPKDLKYWAVKEAGGNIDKVLRFWKQNFFSGRSVFIFRDPMMIVRSILTQARRQNEHMPIKRIHKEVKTAIFSIHRMQRHINSSYVYAITYESLTASTDQTVKNVCKFLDITDENKLLYPTKFSVTEKVGNASKDTVKVFKNYKKWHHDLSLKETICVLLFGIYYKYRVKLNYQTILKQVQQQHSQYTKQS